MTSLSLVLALSLLSPQEPSSGPLAGVQVTISVTPKKQDSQRDLDHTTLLHKDGGFQMRSPDPLGLGRVYSLLDFGKLAMFGLSSNYPNGKFPDLNAFSLGVDWINSDNQGRENTASGAWAALLLSVDDKESDDSDLISVESKTQDGALGDLFCFLLPGSEHPIFENGMTRAMNSDEIAVDDYPGSATRSVGNIDAVDVAMAAFELQLPPTLLPEYPSFYFSVSKATLGDTPADWWPEVSGVVERSSASILCMEWKSDGGQLKWVKPKVFLSYSQLGLAITDDMDGLAVDPIRKRILFSLAGVQAKELMVVIMNEDFDALATGTVPMKYKSRTGVPLGPGATKPGWDAICGLDPRQDFLKFMLGETPPAYVPPVPTFPEPSVPSTLAASFFRVSPATGSTLDTVNSRLVGWPAGGSTSGQGAYLMMTVDGMSPVLVAFATRTSGTSAPVDFSTSILNVTALVDTYATFEWVAYNATSVLGKTAPTRIKLYKGTGGG